MVTCPFSRLSLLVSLCLLASGVFPMSGEAQNRPEVPARCIKAANKQLGFAPRAITLTPLNVRVQIPEYSLLKGQWILGQVVDTLQQDTCIAIVERRDVGIYQIWYLVKYLKDRELRSGWVWGGTIGVDDTQYIGGDKTPENRGEQHGASPQPQGTTPMVSVGLFSGTAYAQADFIPGGGDKALKGRIEVTGPNEKAVDYYARVPLLGFVLSTSTLSAIILFFTMVVGMFAKAIWDQTESDRIMPSLVKVVRPFLISPIAFSAFWGPMYVQQGSAGISLTTVLYAFQIGFMWQHILEKKIAAGGEEKKG